MSYPVLWVFSSCLRRPVQLPHPPGTQSRAASRDRSSAALFHSLLIIFTATKKRIPPRTFHAKIQSSLFLTLFLHERLRPREGCVDHSYNTEHVTPSRTPEHD